MKKVYKMLADVTNKLDVHCTVELKSPVSLYVSDFYTILYP